MRKLRNMKHQSVLTDSQKSMMSSQLTFLRKNIFRIATLENATLGNSTLENSTLENSTLENSTLENSTYCNFRERASDLIYARSSKIYAIATNERGDVPGWVLVVLMTTGLVTGIWTMAAPRIEQILRSSLDSMNGIR